MANRLELSRFLETPALAELGPGPRSEVQSQTEIETKLQPILESSGLTGERHQLIRALILLWHDHLDAAHKLAQEIETPDGAFVHGIMHRREPDFGNAAYWFRRVGDHPAYPQIAVRVSPRLEAASPPELVRRLIRRGAWDPFAFIEACEQASKKPEPPQQLLREIQHEEFTALLEALKRE